MSLKDFNFVNQVLAALPLSEYQRLLPQLQPVRLVAGQILYQPQENIRYVYFPIQSLISLVNILENGTTLEVGKVGREGLVGISTVLGSDSSLHSAVLMFPGKAMRLEVAVLKQEFKRGKELQTLLLLYVQTLVTQVMQNVTCNSKHKTEPRLARLLLSIYDYLQEETFTLTQESIATMLGVRRASVNKAANNLQRANLISYRRGQITILNPSQLERASCECYLAIKNEFQRLFRFYV